MGQLVIEVPQDVNRSYRVADSEFGESLLRKLEDYENAPSKVKGLGSVIPPRRHQLKEDGDAVLGIWSGDEHASEKTAREIREKNRQPK